MKTWNVCVTKTEHYKVTVEAENYLEAREAAELATKDAVPLSTEYSCGSHHGQIVQLGEPWVYSRGWYDLHDPSDVIVIERATGNVFSAEDITVLKERLTGIGLSVLEWWNGTGCNQVSFRCDGRKGDKQLSPDQLKALLAPRT
jgi:hypothetical protein